MSGLAESSLSSVPPARLGALLSERRNVLGLSLTELARRSNDGLSIETLRLAELGIQALDDELVAQLTALYACKSGPVLPIRHKLIVDLDRGSISTEVASTTLPRTSPREILERYLAFVYLMRDITPGVDVYLRRDDVAVLADALGVPAATIEFRLRSMMGSRSVAKQTRQLGKKLSVSAVGLLVGFTSVGALILAPTPAKAEPSRTEVAATETIESFPKQGSIANDVVSEITFDQAQTQPGTQVGPATTQQRTPNAEPVPNAKQESTAPATKAVPSEQVAAPSRSVGAEAEALIGYDWRAQLPGWSVKYSSGRPGYRGLTNRPERTITIYVSNGDSAAETAEVLAHELGHALDLEHLSDAERLQWLEARNMPQVWWAGNGSSDFAVGQGDFAEAVAAILVGSSSASQHGGFSEEQLQLARSFLP